MNIPTRQVRTPTPVTSFDPEVEEQPSISDIGVTPSAEQELAIFVNTEIKKMQEFATIGSGKDPTFFEINAALMNYEQTYLSLLALHNDARWTLKKVQDRYDDWFAHKYIELRDELNPRSLSAQKWYSQKEIEMHVRVKYSAEYQARIWELNTSEQELNFCRRLLEGWQSQQFILTQLSKNLIAESAASNLESTFSRSAD